MNDLLPYSLQIAVAIATILSSLGVIAAFYQIAVTTRQFKRQLSISQNQLSISIKQFKSINQSYLLFVGEPKLVQKPQFLNEVEQKYIGLVFDFNLKNVGNIPLRLSVKKFDFNVDANNVKSLTDIKFILYPEESMPMHISQIHFAKGDEISTTMLSKALIEGEFVITYKDFNSSIIKKLDRKFKIFIQNGIPKMSYTKNDDIIEDIEPIFLSD